MYSPFICTCIAHALELVNALENAPTLTLAVTPVLAGVIAFSHLHLQTNLHFDLP